MFYWLTLPPCEPVSFFLNGSTRVHLEMTPSVFCSLGTDNNELKL